MAVYDSPQSVHMPKAISGGKKKAKAVKGEPPKQPVKKATSKQPPKGGRRGR